MIYKGLLPEESVNAVLNDWIAGTLDGLQLIGSYAIIIWDGNGWNIIVDANGVQNVYYDEHYQCISSSFLMAIAHTNRKSINTSAAIEALTTGTLVGPDTLIDGIWRVEPHQLPDSEIAVTFAPKPDVAPVCRSFNEAVDQQLSYLQRYFESTASFAKREGSLFGLTGGLDSRLNVALALKYWGKGIEVYTNSRLRNGQEKVIDEPLAEKAAEAAGLKMRFGWMTHPVDLSEQRLEEVVNDAFWFFDGHLRMHVMWFEEYNTPRFKKEVANGLRLGVSGIAGEQYRNFEGMCRPYWTFDDFVRYRLMLNVCGPVFLSSEKLNAQVDYVKTKLSRKLDIPKNAHLHQRDIKRYLNEILVSGRLGARNNMENRLYWFLSPFCDASVSFKAYEITPFLGTSIAFENAMVAKLHDKLGKLPTDYGMAPADPLPLKDKIRPWFKEILPNAFYQKRRIDPLNPIGSYPLFNSLNSKFRLINEAVESAKSVQLGIDLDRLCANPELMPQVVNLGFFVKQLNSSDFS
jgi:hypothetical protein